ncbi:MAG TPA: hypothetical protein VF526_15985 [Solirubrobacteraceae bacterium]|jgi:hypothetical protein
MHIWTELAAGESALLAILLLIGAGPAALLPVRFDAASRIALAPILGFCLGTCVTTTALEFVSAGRSYPLLIALALASAAFAAWRTLRSPEHARPSLRDGAQVLVVCIAVAGPLTFVLHERHTVGPAAYYFTDVDNYVAVQEAAATTSLREARAAWQEHVRTGSRFADLTQFIYAFIADFGSNLDATPLGANVNELLGLSSIDTFAPFLVVLLLAGGLGAFAAVRRIAGTPTWTAPLAGALFGGPLLLELWFDSYQAAIIALALLVPTVLLGAEAVRDPRPANLALVALMLACFVTVYPLYVPPLAAIGAAALAWRAIVQRRAGASLPALGRSLALPAIAVAVLTAAFDPVALVRTVGYYHRVLTAGFPFPRVSYALPAEVLPGWLLQTQEFWFLTPIGTAGLRQILLATLIPLALLAFAAVAVRRHAIGLALLGLAVIFGLAAYLSYQSADACTYCAQRYLLALAPILAVLLALGLWQSLRSPARLWQVGGAAGVLLVVLAVGQRARVELDRFADASFFFDSANRAALEQLPRDGRPVHVEGYWASVAAQAEQPLTYHLASDRAPGRVSISLGTSYANAVQYLTLGPELPPGPEFRPDYRYLLTRFSGVATDRRVLARRGAVSLMERTRPLDVTPYTGLNIGLARLDASGIPWARPGAPLRFHVVGRSSARRVWARLTFRLPQPLTVAAQRGVRARDRRGTLTVCVRATGRAPIRDALLQLPTPASDVIRLTGMRAVTGRCAV